MQGRAGSIAGGNKEAGEMAQGTTRRGFLGAAGAGALAAFPLGLAPGLQLWSVREELERDERGTLKKIAGIGYRDLEHYRMPQQPGEFRRRCEGEGLRLVSAHFDMPLEEFGGPKTMEGAGAMGLEYMVVVFPEMRSLRGVDTARMDFHKLSALYDGITLDDYKWNAERMNALGERVKKAGMKLGYHNHAVDLRRLAGGARGLDTLIQGTEAGLVDFEMDCGHMIHAGADPVAYLNQYRGRIRMLHIKDLKAGYSISTTLDTEDKDTNAEIGAGVIDWKRVFAAARAGGVKHWFVEQEGKMDHAPMESIAISYGYLKGM